MTAGWREYFDGLKDQSPLYRVQAGIYVDSLRGAVDVRQHHRVLDFGCGFGFVPALLAPLVAEIGWWEPSLNMRSAAARNTATFANARFCDLSAMYSIATQEVAWPGRGFDLILINSVVQVHGAGGSVAVAPSMARDARIRWPGGIVGSHSAASQQLV